MKGLKVLIADDHKLVRNGIRFTLMTCEHSDSFERIDDAVNGMEAVSRASVLDYDIILMDVNMPEMDGIRATEKIVRHRKDSRVIAISMYDEVFEIRSMISAGASGYVLKNVGSEILYAAITTVLNGGKYYCNEVAQRIIESERRIVRRNGREKNADEMLLTPREVQVLRLIALEYTNDEISNELNLSKRTVEHHRSNVLSKLQAKNTAGMIKYAIKMGYI
jgi:DNA-binding NarL/FixJ family response regulator